MGKRSDTDKAIRNIMNWADRPEWSDERKAVFDAHLAPVCERIDISQEELGQELDEHTNPTPANRYHLVVVGAGTAGLIAASFAAGAGARVALVERHLMGGDCLNVGCVPSKSIIRSSRVFAELRDAAALGWSVPAGAVADFDAVMARMRRIRARISRNDSAVRYRDEKGVDVFLGCDGRYRRPRSRAIPGRRCRKSSAGCRD